MKSRNILGALIVLLGIQAMSTHAEERQLTFSPKNHDLDGTHNFSGDDRFLCYDTRGFAGPGIDNSQSIEQVEIATGEETVLYRPSAIITGPEGEAAPGVGAAYYAASQDTVAFIHGPMVADVPERGFYAKHNRNGMEVRADGSGAWHWLDARDVSTDGDTTPGAHRGGTHDHEYTLDGNRMGVTYDDALLPDYDRTIGYLEPNPRAPAGALRYFALLVPVVKKGTAKPGEIERAWGDNWVDRRGTRRAFIGKVRAADGVGYEQSLFVVEVPETVDITTADSGSATRFPTPPIGTSIRRLTRSHADGIVRCHAPSGRIAYYGGPPEGPKQIFIVPVAGGEDDLDPAMRPVQVTNFKNGVTGGLRWRADGGAIACIADNGVAYVSLTEREAGFGKVTFLTPRGGDVARLNLVWSYDGKTLAYNMRVPTVDAAGNVVRTYDGLDLLQIFLVAGPG
jgi:hypothetical protein